ncbi:MAG: ATP/GTP-binding protein [Candidatus Bathyarchaeia archaeon]|nr:ATP/GTP-binding protein [Candidatus Bathyarchaeota archaeon]
MNIIFILGTAGSGKSELTGSFTSWLEQQGEDVISVNLDPGAITLPYSPSVSVRDYVKVEEVMEEYSLGPNGGLMLACDMVVDVIDEIYREIQEFVPEVVLIDTPGQMELFAFRDTGARIAERLAEESKAIIYLFDSVFCRDPLNYVMNMFIASAINTRFLLPQVSALSKADLLSEEEIEGITGWGEDPLLLEAAIDSRLEGVDRILSQDMMDIINRLGLEFNPIPISSRTYEGFSWLYSELARILTRGERFTQ